MKADHTVTDGASLHLFVPTVRARVLGGRSREIEWRSTSTSVFIPEHMVEHPDAWIIAAESLISKHPSRDLARRFGQWSARRETLLAQGAA